MSKKIRQKLGLVQKEQMQILISVILSMVIIIAIWLIWFFPIEKTETKQSSNGFTKFAKEIINSFSIFEDKTYKKTEVDVNDLRERVFGDTIER